MSRVWWQPVRLKGGMCDRGAVRLGVGYGLCKWRSRFPSPFSPGLTDNSQSEPGKSRTTRQGLPAAFCCSPVAAWRGITGRS